MIERMKWLHQQAGAYLDMIEGAKALGILYPGRAREELEALLAQVYRCGVEDAASYLHGEDK